MRHMSPQLTLVAPRIAHAHAADLATMGAVLVNNLSSPCSFSKPRGGVRKESPNRPPGSGSGSAYRGDAALE